MALLETVGDYEFSATLTHNLSRIADELERFNNRAEAEKEGKEKENDLDTLFNIVSDVISKPTPDRCTVEYRRYREACGSLMEAIIDLQRTLPPALPANAIK